MKGRTHPSSWRAVGLLLGGLAFSLWLGLVLEIGASEQPFDPAGVIPTQSRTTEHSDFPTLLLMPVSQSTTTIEADLSLIFVPMLSKATYDVGPPLPVPMALSAEPPIDFEQITADLKNEGYDLSYNKIGFHAGDRGRWADLVPMMKVLDAAGIPFFLKSTDNAEPIFIAQELMRQSGVEHTLVYRRVTGVDNVPNYNAEPAAAARFHWNQHKDIFPPELDPALVWLETVNEVDKQRAEWLADFAYETAQLTLKDGFRWAAFGWSSGEPGIDPNLEALDWESPAMLRFLRLAAEHPEDLAIALHEYSYERDDVGAIYPYRIGRFQFLFDTVDRFGIPRPTVLITEWGWTFNKVPSPDQAIKDIAWASWLYAAYPQVKGAAIWYLGDTPGTIEDQTAALIPAVTDFSMSHYYAIKPGLGKIDSNLFAPHSVINLTPQETSIESYLYP